MPWSTPEGKTETLQLLEKRWPLGATVLDIGPGAGAMRHLLPFKFVMDCVEIFAPYVDRFRLRDIYREVTIADVRTWPTSKRYDVAILGDVLEHLRAEEADDLLQRLALVCEHIVVSVPWMYVQGPSEGNEAEEHLQPDLTPEVMAKRYPRLVMRFQGSVVGIYEWIIPAVSLCIPTYARTKLLEIALTSALEAKSAYPGPVEILVLNDCPEQHLRCLDERVRIVNQSTSCPTLGAKRNALLDLASNGMIAWLDDDDYLLTHHLFKAMRLASVTQALMGSRVTLWFCNGNGEVTSGACADTLVRTKQAREVRYKDMDVGEDWDFIERMDKHAGIIWDESNDPTYVQRWCNGAWHMSGQGIDPDAVKKFRANAQERFANGQEPRGEVLLRPEAARTLEVDYNKLAPKIVADWKLSKGIA